MTSMMLADATWAEAVEVLIFFGFLAFCFWLRLRAAERVEHGDDED